jgi:CHAD domain-containing protein
MTEAATEHETDPAGRTPIGAAMTGAGAAADPPSAPTPPSRTERKYRLRRSETVADGIRRAVRGRLADSSDALAGPHDRDELGAAVHATRKSIKRVRAALRLSRDALGTATYEYENATFRAIAQRLSGARDGEVLIDTLEELERRIGDDLGAAATQRLHDRLADDHVRAVAALGGDGDLAVTARRPLDEARARAGRWTLRPGDFGAVEPGLKRIYRQGRKRLRAARAEPTPEHLHDLRKRAKDLWHASELLRAAHPKRMKRLGRDAHALADLLGDHHDLSVLREYAEANPQLFSDMAARETVLDALDERRETLQRRALKLGRKLYKRRPKRFVKDIARGWDARAASQH